jgi:hypothetical protein
MKSTPYLTKIGDEEVQFAVFDLSIATSWI